MKNAWVYIRLVFLSVFVISSILGYISRDYITTFTSETKSSEVSSSSQETATVRIVENPDGSKHVFVEASVNLKLSDGVSGQFFDSSKYERYRISIAMQKKIFDTLKDIWDRYFKQIALFVALLSIPFALLALTSKKAPFLR